MPTVRKLRYFTSATAASLVLVAATGNNFGDQLLSTSEFVHSAQNNGGGVIIGPPIGTPPPPPPVNNGGGVIIGTPIGTPPPPPPVNNGGGVIGVGSYGNSAGALRGGPTYKPR